MERENRITNGVTIVENRYTVRFVLSHYGARVQHFMSADDALAFVDYLRGQNPAHVSHIVVQSPTAARVVNFNAPRISQVSR